MAKKQGLGHAIRVARLAAGLTQKRLGLRLELKGRAIYRWERDEVAPTARHRRSLIQEIQARNPNAALQLKAVLIPEPASNVTAAPPAPTQPQPPLSSPETTVTPPAPTQPEPPPTLPNTFELAVLRMADELDLPARRIRRPLARLLARMRASSCTLEAAEQELEDWIAQSA
jgi:transcriptional regulator with XRE-family HTH domain